MYNRKIFLQNPNQSGSGSGSVVATSGRTLYRHSSGMGTVMEFTDTQARSVLVLDAAYRGTGLYMANSGMKPNLPAYGSYNVNGTCYVDGGDVGTTAQACAHLTDDDLNTIWANKIDSNTSKYNCDTIITKATEQNTLSWLEGINHCRAITVNGVGCDVPNIQILQRIYCDADAIDALDPTVNSYTANALGALNPVGNFCIGGSNTYVWASTYWGLGMWNYGCCWLMSSVGFCDSRWFNYRYNVIPVLELEYL